METAKLEKKCKACVIAFAVCLADTTHAMSIARVTIKMKNL